MKMVCYLLVVVAFGCVAAVTRMVELPTAIPKIENFQVKKAQDVVHVMKENSTSNQELVPVLQKMIQSLSKDGNITDAGKAMLNDMLVTFSRKAEGSARDEQQKPLTEEQLKEVLGTMGLKEGDTEYNVTKTREGNVKIIVEEIETDDPTAKDQIVLDYNKTVEKGVEVDGAEQDDGPS